jgi:hypothetical protein
MKKIFTVLALLFVGLSFNGQTISFDNISLDNISVDWEDPEMAMEVTVFRDNAYKKAFFKAYYKYQLVPKGMLEAVAYTQSRFTQLEGKQQSCIGYPATYGVMGLVKDGKGYFRNNLKTVSDLSGYSQEEIMNSAETSIMAYAAAYQNLMLSGLRGVRSPEDVHKKVLTLLSELPLSENVESDFALNSHLYQIFYILNDPTFSFLISNGNPVQFNMSKLFGNNLEVLSSKHIVIDGENIRSSKGAKYTLNNPSATKTMVTTSPMNAASVAPDYGPAIWNPTTCNFSSRAGTPITAVAIHDVEGSYAGCISWFKNCSANASAHYVIRSLDGQITQMVYESDKAWHIGSENPYTLGIEHEGYNNNPAWYTQNMYVASAALVKDMCADNNINPLRTYYGAGCSGTTQQCGLGACTRVKGHQMFPNQTHNDPGPFWNWDKFYRLINNTYSIAATYTANSGAFYDSGGASGNYGNDERKVYLFTKAGATNITLNFTQFDLENGWDHMFIYDGGKITSPLIGKFSGTVNPGPIVSNNDSLTIEFRSDCATTKTGWAANYTMNGGAAPTTTDITSPNTVVNTVNAWKTAAFTASITDQDNVGGSGVEKGYYQAIDYNGTEWRANYTRGFLADNFDNAIHPEWTQSTGTWGIASNALVQTDEVSTAAGNTNIYASLTQNLSNRYLYHFLAKFEGTGVSRRGGLHFACDNPSMPNRNNSYFVWFRLDDQKVEIYKTVNDVIGTPKVSQTHTFTAGQWYDVKVIYDRITGKISVYWNNALIASWTDTTPYANGNSVSFRSGNCKMSIDEIKVYRSRAATVNLSVGSGNANDLRYRNPNPLQPAGKIKSICQDSAGNLSPIFYHDVNVDWTPPSNIATINDGPGADINLVNTTDSLRANWSNALDSNSAVVRYWYSIGTAPGATNTSAWTSNWAATAVTANSLVLVHNTFYYFNIKAENGAGLFSSVISSNGQKVDTTAGTVGLKEELPVGGLSIYPNPFTESITLQLNLQESAAIQTTLIDVQGKVIASYRFDANAGAFEKNLQFPYALAKGTYWLQFTINNKAYYKKLVKE